MICRVAIGKVVGVNGIHIARQVLHGNVIFPEEGTLACMQEHLQGTKWPMHLTIVGAWLHLTHVVEAFRLSRAGQITCRQLKRKYFTEYTGSYGVNLPMAQSRQ